MLSGMDIIKIKAQSEEELLAEVVHQLVAALQPERIYLFGSRARGDYRDGSDYDIMVIVPDSLPDEPRPFELANQALAGMLFHRDLKVWQHSNFFRQTHLKASMPSAVLRDGKLLYKREDSEIISLGSETPRFCEETSAYEDQVLVENTCEWLRKARNDLRYAEFGVGASEDLLEEALFHCQQAVEKAAKAFLVWHDYPAGRIHSLEGLGTDCLTLDPTLEPVLRRSYHLDGWDVRGRYPDERQRVPAPTIGQAEDGLEAARAVFDAVLARMPENIRTTFQWTP